MSPLFTGVGVALVTLFDERGRLDAPATADLAAQLVDLGVQSVVVAGSTGEASALAADERSTLTRTVREAVPAGIPVLAGTGAATGEQAAELTRRAFADGADAVLVLSPPRVSDPRPYYDTVAKAAAGGTVLAYHFPRVSPPGVAVEMLPELPVAGLKDSTGDPERLLQECTTIDGDVYAGSSALVMMAGAIGATGAILAVANAEPEKCIAAFAGDAAAQKDLLPAHLTARTFPAGIKGLVAERFGTGRTARIGG
jgi:4-hydroxy-tetrahydrodipicolinate synthase